MDIDYEYGLLMENHLDLMYLPSGAVAWLFDRPESQIQAASRIGVEAKRYDNQITDAVLLRGDQNVLILKTKSGISIKVYPDGGYGVDGQPYDLNGICELLQNVPGPEQGEVVVQDRPMGIPQDTLRDAALRDLADDLPEKEAFGGMDFDMPSEPVTLEDLM